MQADSKSEALMRNALAHRVGEAGGASVPASFPPPMPDHTLLRRIGQGAYGDVWLARNALGTLRAVKIVYRARFKEDRPYEREFNGILKYEPISRTHEGLVQVLHVGRNNDAGCFYYVMELADPVKQHPAEDVRSVTSTSVDQLETIYIVSYVPRTLRSELAVRPRLPPTDAAQLVLRLAAALGHLHKHGLVHRDIKPSNVIFVGGQPKLADIGLVTDVGSSRSFVGTEGFIPPEGPGTPQADIYGLGKLLYELATGRDRMDFPQLPAGVMQLPEGEALLELNEVMTRACAPEPEERYFAATELQAELNLFLAGRSLRRARNLERHLARLKRFAFAACAFLLVAAAVVWFAKREERRALQTAQVESRLRHRAEAAEHQSQQQLYAALLEQARATVRAGELGHRVRALAAIGRAAAISNTAELRREAIAALALPDLRFDRELATTTDATYAQLSPKFDYLALGQGRGPVEIRAASDGGLFATLPASTNLPAYGLHWSPNGRFLAVKRDREPNGSRGDLEVWELPAARQVLLVRDMRWGARSFHPRRAELLTGHDDGLMVAWDLAQGKELQRRTFTVSVEHLLHSPEGDRVAASYRLDTGWRVSIHNTADAAETAFQLFPNRVATVAWHPGGRWLGVADFRGMIHLMDCRDGAIRTLDRHKAEAVLTAFSPDGRYLLSGGWERELICWDLQTMQRAFTIPLDSFTAQFNADGTQCAVFSSAGVKFHAFEKPQVRDFAEDLGARLRHAVFSPDGRWIAASGDDRLGVWDLATHGPGALADEGAEVRPFFTPDGHELFASGNRQGLRWRVTSSANDAPPQLERLEFPNTTDFSSLCLASDVLAVNSAQGTRLITQTATNAWAQTSSGIADMSPDGRWLGLYRPFSTSLYIHRLPGLERVAKLTHPVSIGSFKFSPRGDELAISSRGQVEFWRMSDWTRTRVATNFIRILYSADPGAYWLTKGLYGGGGLYDARTLEPLLPLPAGTVPLALSPNDRHLAVNVDARRLVIWDLQQLRKHLRELGLDWERGQ